MRKSRVLSGLLGFSLFLGSCGELGTVFESQGSYRVNALVDSQYTLDEYSIINQNSKISPFFVNSVVNDPDVRGLMIFVQDLSGTIVSRKIHYVLAGKTPALPGATGGANQGAEESGADSKPENSTESPVGSDSTDGEDTTTTDMEEQVVVVKQLDQSLSVFSIFENLPIGRYNLVFQVLGEKAILYTAVKPIYYLRDADFTLGEIQSYLPGIPTGGRLIPPGTNVLLETEISADSRLDPLVIWYNGKKVIAQGRASEGAQQFLWKTPEQTGFHTVRAEVFPLLPAERVPENIRGKVKELSLAISSKSGEAQYGAGYGDDFIHWYQFRGNLDDAKAANNPEQQLIPLPARKPRWLPIAGVYGLFAGPQDGYTLPGKPFVLSGGEQGKGRIVFRFAPLSAGTIFNVRFAAIDGTTGTAALDVSLAEGNVTLHISSGSESYQASLALKANETDTLITAFINVEIAPDRLGASLVLDNPARETAHLALAVSKLLNGEAVIRFGGTEQSGTAIFNELAISYTRLPLSPDTGMMTDL